MVLIVLRSKRVDGCAAAGGGKSTGSGTLLSAMAGGRLSRNAVIGLVIGLLTGMVLVVLAFIGIQAALRRRNAVYQVRSSTK